MRRILSAFSALILCAACILSLAACDGSNGNIDNSKDGIIGDSDKGDTTTAPMSDRMTDDMTDDMNGNVTDDVSGSVTDDGMNDTPAESGGSDNGMDIGGGDDSNNGDDSGVNEGISNSLDPRLGITTDGSDR